MDAALRTDSGLDFVEEFASAAEWFATHLGRTAARHAVPACPAWSVVDLTAHLGNVHGWAATVVETGQRAGELDDRPASARSRRMADWYLAKAEDLYEVLRNTPADKPCWNFAFGEGTAAFWARRQTHETVMHGVDLAQAGHHEERLPLRLAVDGIEETLGVFLHRMHQRGHAAQLVHAVSLVATDADLAWTVAPVVKAAIPAQVPAGRRGAVDRPVPRIVRGAEPDADRVEAPARVLHKLLWKREPVDHPEVKLLGDEQRVRAFLASRLTA